MDHFNYKDNTLFAEEVDVNQIAKDIGTPFYCYSKATLQRHYKVFADSFKNIKATICFAVKSNCNLHVIKALAELGAGADCVSEGEIRQSIHAGVPADKIVFSGVGKTREEINYAIKANIMQFNIESEAELHTISQEAIKLGKTANIAFRVNPDVDAKTHEHISTGKKTDKFGIDYDIARDLYKKASKLEGINIISISTHIGSQLTDLKPFKEAFIKIIDLLKKLREDGHNITRLDLGGGLGIPYKDETPPSPTEYAEMIIDLTKDLGVELVFEPGRMIAGNSGIMVSKIIYIKETDHKKFAIIDAAMNDLMRPALYSAWHDIVMVNKDDGPLEEIDIAGPICESTDFFARNRLLPKNLKSEDLIAFRTAGAYGSTMASTYNLRPLIAEVMVDGDEYKVIRKRQSYTELLKMNC